MAKNSRIEWTDHTFNPWWGCAKVSPACDNCYAERDAKRHAPGQILWGDGSTRRTFGDLHWKEPYRWARQAAKLGEHAHRPRVFCASMADVFDNHPDVEGQRQRLWAVIEGTPELDWLLLTKRIGNAKTMLPRAWRESPRRNVWLGISVVNQAEADRDIPKLLATPARIRFLSCEPLLGPIDARKYLRTLHWETQLSETVVPGVDWVIAGGESGPHARPMHPTWVERIRADCAATSTAFFFKQWGEWAPVTLASHPVDAVRVSLDGREVGYVVFGGAHMARVGKKNAGRELQREGRGEVWSQFPASA